MNSYKKSKFLFNASLNTPVGAGYSPLIVSLTKLTYNLQTLEKSAEFGSGV